MFNIFYGFVLSLSVAECLREFHLCEQIAYFKTISFSLKLHLPSREVEIKVQSKQNKIKTKLIKRDLFEAHRVMSVTHDLRINCSGTWYDAKLRVPLPLL